MYEVLISDDVLTIPCRLSGALTVDMEFSENTKTYLKAKLTKLSDRDKNISIVMGEVKTNQRIEYVAGKFPGVDDGEITKGLFSVMVKSLGGKY